MALSRQTKDMTGLVERFVVCTGDADTFDVIVGRKLNREPLSRAEAYRLAGSSAAAVPAPKPKPVVDDWSSRGGSSGFSIDNNLWSGKKPW